jgi:hypothetical protein
MNPSIPGADLWVYEAVVDGSGNLYIGGAFIVGANRPSPEGTAEIHSNTLT